RRDAPSTTPAPASITAVLGRSDAVRPSARRAGRGRFHRSEPARVELRGFEPLTPSMRTRCATGLRYSPEGPGDTSPGRDNLSRPRAPPVPSGTTAVPGHLRHRVGGAQRP